MNMMDSPSAFESPKKSLREQMVVPDRLMVDHLHGSVSTGRRRPLRHPRSASVSTDKYYYSHTITPQHSERPRSPEVLDQATRGWFDGLPIEFRNHISRQSEQFSGGKDSHSGLRAIVPMSESFWVDEVPSDQQRTVHQELLNLNARVKKLEKELEDNSKTMGFLKIAVAALILRAVLKGLWL
eukprot:Clim_evm16s128 gene=Clim_evmTU16s128